MATYIKVNGTWQTVSGDTAGVCGYVKVDGTWRSVTNTYVKVDGTWRSVCAPLPTPTPTPTPTPGGGGVTDPPQDSSVSSLSPNNGAAAGGYTVTLNGSFPSNLTNISVNGTNLGSFSRQSSSAYTFTMPAGTQGTTVQVQAWNGRVPLMSSLTFTYNSEGGSGVTCSSPNYCSSIQYSDGTTVTVNATNGTFNGSLQTEACGNGGTRTKAYTCITPSGCANISVGAGQCTGETTTTYYYVSGCCAQNTAGEINSPAYGVSTSGYGAALSNATSACYYSLTGVQYSNSTYPSVSCGGGTTPCSCTALSTTTGTRSVSTSTCSSGIMNTSTSTYNQCCVTNGTVNSTTVTSDTVCYTPPAQVTCGSCGTATNIPSDVEYNVCNGVQLCSSKTTTYQRKYCSDGQYSYDCTPVVTYSGCVNSSTCGYTPSCTCNYAGAGYCVNGVTWAPECCTDQACCTQGPACSTAQTWYCTTSVNSNCAGCTQSTATSNVSSSGTGYSTSCSTSGYPSCGTPCSTPSPSPTPTPTTSKKTCSQLDYDTQCCSCFSVGACDANGSVIPC